MRSYDIGSRIDNMCRLYCVDMKEMEMLGKSMLKLFRDVCRGNADSAEELLADLCSDSGESDELRRINESVVRLQFFTQDARRAVYEESIQTVIETGTMLRIMDAIKAKLYAFPDYGPEFVSILTMSYMSNFEYTVDEILDELKLSRSAFFRKKKYATILFGLTFTQMGYLFSGVPKTKKEIGFTGEQMRMDLRWDF